MRNCFRVTGPSLFMPGKKRTSEEEILADPDLMAQIKEGRKHPERLRDFEEVARELGI